MSRNRPRTRTRQASREQAAYYEDICTSQAPPRRTGHSTASPSYASDASYRSSSSLGVTGLNNLGNTCYMNAVLQVLGATRPLARIIRDELSRDSRSASALVLSLARLLPVMQEQRHASVSPVTACAALRSRFPQFASSEQQDAQEAFSAMLDAMHEDFKQTARRRGPVRQQSVSAQDPWRAYFAENGSIIARYFCAQEQSVLECRHCGFQSASHSPSWCTSLPLTRAPDHRLTLYDLLDAYFGSEELRGANRWHCPRCRTRRSATKSASFSRLPPILAMHISRVSASGVKSSEPVAFPCHNLDMSRYGRKHTAYDLYAIIDHHGPAGDGHYTATIRRAPDVWVTISDSEILPVRLEEVRRAHRDTCYMLLYERQRVD